MNKIFFVIILYFISQNLNGQLNLFVKIKNNIFEINNKPYKYIGANYWYGSALCLTENGKKRVQKELQFLAKNGVNNLRILVGAEGEGLVNGVKRVGPPLQTSKGVFNDKILIGLDFLLAEMEKLNIKAVLFLSNNWEWSGGFLQYLNWNGKLEDSIMYRKLSWEENRDIVSQFYNCNECKNDYYNQIKYVLIRTNSITKRKYINDPTIMSWELANEPRPMRPTAINNYLQWIEKSANLIKSIDKNHLVTIGSEGYIGTEGMEVFKASHQFSNIDYATIHIWPKNWAWYKDSTFEKDFDNVIIKTKNYISEHVEVAKKIKKPLVIEEFGLPRDGFSFSPQSSVLFRDKYFESILKRVVNINKNEFPIAGLNFWAFSGFGKARNIAEPFWKDGDDLLGDPPMEEQGLNSVFATDTTTWKLIKNYSNQLYKYNNNIKK